MIGVLDISHVADDMNLLTSRVAWVVFEVAANPANTAGADVEA